MRKSTQAFKGVRPRLRILLAGEIALGPGKIELLEFIEKTGSITEAARQMNMSYMRAWTLIRTMNRCFRKPVVVASRGGAAGGRAELTPTGARVLRCYRQMEVDCIRAAKGGWRKITKLLLEEA